MTGAIDNMLFIVGKWFQANEMIFYKINFSIFNRHLYMFTKITIFVQILNYIDFL